MIEFMNKLTFTTYKDKLNQPTNTYTGHWYGPRPLQIVRNELNISCVAYGPMMKLLKNGCNTCKGPVVIQNGNVTRSTNGNVISFGGGSGIRSATTNLSQTYYSDTSAYLRSRGQSFKTNTDIHKIPGIDYANSSGPIWPETDQLNGNSSMYASNAQLAATLACTQPVTIYKPNNSGFSTQGAVSSSTRTLKSKENARNSPSLTPYQKKQQKSKCTPQPYWGTLG